MLSSEKIVINYKTNVTTHFATKVSLRIDNSYGMATDVRACYNKSGQPPGADGSCELQYVQEESNETYSTFTGEICFAETGYRTFYISLRLNGECKLIEYDISLQKPVLTDWHNRAFWQIFVYEYSFQTPDWVKGGIMYQIFIDTFYSKDLSEQLCSKVVSWDTYPKWEPDCDGIYRNTQFYGGNLKGVIAKLDYLKTLNVSVIYITPIFKSQSSNRYDIDDYEVIDEMIGDWEDLAELHEKANALGMKIIVDMVFNHSGGQNKLIVDEPEMYDWIHKYDVPKCWWGYKNLVEFNKYSEKYFDYLTKWLEKYRQYMDGIRLDVADNLPDFVLKFIREKFGKYLLGEVWKNAVLGDGRDFLAGKELDGVMNYQTANAIYRYLRWGNYKNFKEIMRELSLYPSKALDVSPIFLSSHDIPRIPNILVGDFMKEDVGYETVWSMEQDNFWIESGHFDTYKFRKWEFENEQIQEDKKDIAVKLHKIAVFMQYTLPGLPSIFAGDEAGVIGFKDPFNRKPFPWDNINQELYRFYCNIGTFRSEHREVFSDSRNFEILVCDEQKLIYKRGGLICCVNRTGDKVKVEYDLKNTLFNISEVQSNFCLPAFGAIVI